MLASMLFLPLFFFFFFFFFWPSHSIASHIGFVMLDFVYKIWAKTFIIRASNVVDFQGEQMDSFSNHQPILFIYLFIFDSFPPRAG